MYSLSTLALRGLRRQAGRTVLTAAGAALGVAVLCAVVVVSGTTAIALDQAVTGTAGRSDVAIEPLGGSDAVLDPRLADRAEGLDGVEMVLGSHVMRTALDSPGGRPSRSTSDRIVAIVGADLDRVAEVRELTVIAGALPEAGTDELVVSSFTAADVHLAPGDRVQVATPSGIAELTVSGVLDDVGGGLAYQGKVGYAWPDTVAALDGRGRVVTGLDVVLDDAVDVDLWIEEHSARLGDAVSVEDAATRDSVVGFRDFVTAISSGLALLSCIAVFVGGFLVFLTFSVAVAERTRTYGTLRAIGAQPRQIKWLVLREAAVLGATASVVGIIAGHGLAALALSVAGDLFDLPLPAFRLSLSAAGLGLLVGIGVSLVAALLPARRAAGLGPTTAMSSGAATFERRGLWWARSLVFAAGVAAVAMAGSQPVVRGLATFVVLLGAVLLVPFALGSFGYVVGRVSRRRGGGIGHIAVLHLVKERNRSAYTVALVMVVLAMLFAIAGTHAAMETTLARVVDRQFGGAVRVYAAGVADPSLGDQLAAVPGTAGIAAVQFGRSERIDGARATPVQLFSIEPESYFDVASFPWVDGDDASARRALAGGRAALIPHGSAGPGVGRGDTIELRTTDGVRTFTVAGTFATLGPTVGVVVGTVGDAFAVGRPNGFLVAAQDGVDPDRLASVISDELGTDHDLVIDTSGTRQEWAREQLRGFLGLAYAILAVAGLVGTLGLASTLAVSVISRTREIGILRSVGARRRQLNSMVVAEAVTLTSIALVLSLPLGLLLTFNVATLFRDSLGITIDATVPWGVTVPLLLVTLAVAVVAAVGPARRAGRLDPVAALRVDQHGHA